ncbi:Hypothetical protein NCS54_01242100 [Fusarium falciforme]|uniref:Hypothetical protein n=1 Tax=Fusarium falciforme TaxID=195108 RepID=UPI00230064E6|nr:Hypothetical protein NCS54_01242100 [Fusarium falciforme]WAO94819.1 Hypothetical protein NCS54_01242100 [Fusarium falciforme]
MGILFSRPAQETFPEGAYPVGNISSLNASSIFPYAGINTGLYGGIPTSNLPPIPFEWIVSPDADRVTDSCPNGDTILTFFGVSEAVITILVPIFAYRPFIHRLSRGWLGRRSKNSIAVAWTVTFACQLLANAIIAGMIGNTPGYGHLNMLRIFTVYMTRPRFHFIVLALLRSLVGVKRPREWDKTTIINRRLDNRIEFPFTDSYIAVVASEMLVFIISAIFTGVTWHRYPKIEMSSREYMDDHINYVSSIPGVMCLCLLGFVPIYKRYGDAFPIEGRRYETGRHWGATVAADGTARVAVKRGIYKGAAVKRIGSAVAAAALMGYATLVQWSYWTRFLELPGVLFCPPKMIETGIIWAVFTLIGVLAGAAS